VPLVEREVELAWLREMYTRTLRDPWVRLITLLGAPGIGKTRLVAELGRVVDADPGLVSWRVGRPAPAGSEDGLGGVFWALAEIIEAEAGIRAEDAGEVRAHKLDRAVGATLSDAHHALS
jgi:hypothetical protein